MQDTRRCARQGGVPGGREDSGAEVDTYVLRRYLTNVPIRSHASLSTYLRGTEDSEPQCEREYTVQSTEYTPLRGRHSPPITTKNKNEKVLLGHGMVWYTSTRLGYYVRGIGSGK